MSKAEALRVLGSVRIDEAHSYDSDCRMLFPKNGPPDLYVMTEGDIVSRITAWGASKLKTDKGLGVGSTEDEVRAAYGRTLEIAPSDYGDVPARNLVAWAVKGKAGVRYETDEHRHVTTIHVGGPAILYSEDCE
jgi:hypothetical protein